MATNEWPFQIAIYGAGEAIDATGALSPYIAAQISALGKVVTNRYVAATAQLDSSNVPTLRWVLDPQGRWPVESLSNVDVGDPAALVEYAYWSNSICPAGGNILVLSGHGAAWQDAMLDEVLGFTRNVVLLPDQRLAGALHHARSIFGAGVSPTREMTRAILVDGHYKDYLSNTEFGSACNQIASLLRKPIDVLVLDACLMSAWEILQELQGSVSTVVASIDELSAAGISLVRAAEYLTQSSGQMNAQTVATTIAQTFQPRAHFDTCIAIDLASPQWAVALGQFRMFSTGLLTWVSQSGANRDAVLNAFRAASSSLVKYNSSGLADIGSFCAALSQLPAEKLRSSLDECLTSISACVLARSTGRDYKAAVGLSIFAPDSYPQYARNRSDYESLKFSLVTGWSNVLDTIFGLDQIRPAG